MIEEKITLRVRYSETDRMGFVYYGDYAQYLELGRVAAMKKVGISYKKLEDSGIGLPVKNMHIEYYKAAEYDDEITVITRVEEMPANRITFNYEIHGDGSLLAKAATTLFFIDFKSKRPCRPPSFFIDKMKNYFD